MNPNNHIITGFKTCPNCISYKHCPENLSLKAYIKDIMPPEVPIEKIIIATAFLAEACPQYFTWKDAEK